MKTLSPMSIPGHGPCSDSAISHARGGLAEKVWANSDETVIAVREKIGDVTGFLPACQPRLRNPAGSRRPKRNGSSRLRGRPARLRCTRYCGEESTAQQLTMESSPSIAVAEGSTSWKLQSGRTPQSNGSSRGWPHATSRNGPEDVEDGSPPDQSTTSCLSTGAPQLAFSREFGRRRNDHKPPWNSTVGEPSESTLQLDAEERGNFHGKRPCFGSVARLSEIDGTKGRPSHSQ